MESKIILITGATQGLGKITAIELAKQGHQIIIHGRNRSKLEEVRKEIISITGNQKIDLAIADLLSLEGTARMANEMKTKNDRLDVLINNAGAMFTKKRETTKEGFEKTFTLNLFAPLLLMLSLTDLLSKVNRRALSTYPQLCIKEEASPTLTIFKCKTITNQIRPMG